MKMIYWCDIIDSEDPYGEIEIIKKKLLINGIDWDGGFRAYDFPVLDKKFDVLFFDWGGMSLGNSLLESFCDEILEHAEEHPSKIYVMTSTFTESAMKDAMYQYGDRIKDVSNVFLNIKSAIPYLKSQMSEDTGL